MRIYRVRDPIHGLIEFNELEKRIIDTPIFQRLRGFHQLSLAFLVYPGATHSRFEHSLGVMHISGKMSEKVGLDVQLARLCGLLHDVGHGAFSHDSERLYSPILGDHEKVGEKIIKEYFSDTLGDFGYSLKDIFNSDEGKLVSSDLGSDRLDYLLRDSYYTGVAYGIIEYDMLIEKLGFDEKVGVFVKAKGLESLESLFLGRFMMFFTVYLHKTVRIAQEMLFNALKEGLEKGIISEWDLITRSDYYLLQVLSENNVEWASKIMRRELFKPILITKSQNISEAVIEVLEEEGITFLLSTPPKVVKGFNVYVETSSGFLPVNKVSPLIRALKRAEKEKANIIVAVDKKDLNKAAELIKNVVDNIEK